MPRRLGEDNYVKTGLSKTDKNQNHAYIKKVLQNYTLIKDLDRETDNTHVRYITFSNGKHRFRYGGFLVKIAQKYVVISNGKFTWSVQRYHFNKNKEVIFETQFYKLKTVSALKDEYKKLKKENTKLRTICTQLLSKTQQL